MTREAENQWPQLGQFTAKIQEKPLQINELPVATKTWPGRNVGIRAPDPDETPLSPAEVLHAARKGMLSAISWQLAELDTEPPVRRRVGAGAWRPMQGPKAGPFDGLLGSTQ